MHLASLTVSSKPLQPVLHTCKRCSANGILLNPLRTSRQQLLSSRCKAGEGDGSSSTGSGTSNGKSISSSSSSSLSADDAVQPVMAAALVAGDVTAVESNANTISSGSEQASTSADSASSGAPAKDPISVAAVQANPAATIDAINRMTRLTDEAAAAAAAGASGRQQQQQQPPEDLQTPQQQQPLSATLTFLRVAATNFWSAVQRSLKAILGLLAAAAAAVQGSLSKFPGWVAAQKLQKLKEAADSAPKDATKQAAYLAALNSSHPKEVLARVESKVFSSSPAVVVEYLKALVSTERINEYADAPGLQVSAASAAGSSVSSGIGLGPLPAAGQDHRSLLVLLKELEGLADGSPAAERPGSSLRRPLHVTLQVTGSEQQEE
jgi:hypothetical protein